MIGNSSGRNLPWDVVAVLVYAAAVVPLQWVDLPSSPRIVLLAPALLFLPGFTLSTVLFPGRSLEEGSNSFTGFASRTSPSEAEAAAGERVARLGLIDRAAVSVGVSVALLPVFAFGFDIVLGSVVGPIIVVTTAFSAVMAVLGGILRLRVPAGDRFEIPIRRWFDELATSVTDTSTGVAVVNVVLVGSVVLAVGAVGIAFVAPQQGATFTEFAVGTEQDGEFVSGDYPDDLAVGETAETAILIENHEGDPTEYSVVARFESVEDGTVTAVEDAGEFSVTVEPGATVVETHRVTRSMRGDDIRLRFLLYRGEPPTDPSPANAYRSVHLWVDVE